MNHILEESCENKLSEKNPFVDTQDFMAKIKSFEDDVQKDSDSFKQKVDSLEKKVRLMDYLKDTGVSLEGMKEYSILLEKEMEGLFVEKIKKLKGIREKMMILLKETNLTEDKRMQQELEKIENHISECEHFSKMLEICEKYRPSTFNPSA